MYPSCRVAQGDTLTSFAGAFADTTTFRVNHAKCDSLRNVFTAFLPERVLIANHDDLAAQHPPPPGQSVGGTYVSWDSGYIVFASFLFATIHNPHDAYASQ